MKKNSQPILIILGIVFLFVLGMTYLHMQNNNPAEEKGSISGIVVDAATNTPLKSVSVSATDKNKNTYSKHENVDTTGSDGYFCLDLPPKEYILTFEADGYQPLTSSATYLIPSDDTNEIKEPFRLVKIAEMPSNAYVTSNQANAISTTGDDSTSNIVNYTVVCIGPSEEELGRFQNVGNKGETEIVPAPQFENYQPDESEKSIILKDNDNTLKFYYRYEDNSTHSKSKKWDIPEDAVVFQGHSYYIYEPAEGNWDDVLRNCVLKGGYPVVVNDSAENEFLFDYMVNSGRTGTFIGFTDTDVEGSWKWVYGKESDFSDWGINSRGHQQPNSESKEEDWAQMDSRMYEGHWNDCKYGQDTFAYFCEWDGVQSE